MTAGGQVWNDSRFGAGVGLRGRGHQHVLDPINFNPPPTTTNLTFNFNFTFYMAISFTSFKCLTVLANNFHVLKMLLNMTVISKCLVNNNLQKTVQNCFKKSIGIMTMQLLCFYHM